MKKSIINITLISIATIILIITACETLDIVKVTMLDTGQVSEIKPRSANMNGEIIDICNNNINEIGYCWSENENPTINDDKDIVNIIAKQGEVIHTIIENLNPDSRYNVRAYVITNEGEIYGNNVNFITEKSLFKVIEPTSNALWAESSVHEIKWNYDDDTQNVNIELYKKGMKIIDIVTDENNNGTYNWNIPTGLPGSGAVDRYFTIRISNINNTNEIAESEEFYIGQ